MRWFLWTIPEICWSRNVSSAERQSRAAGQYVNRPCGSGESMTQRAMCEVREWASKVQCFSGTLRKWRSQKCFHIGQIRVAHHWLPLHYWQGGGREMFKQCLPRGSSRSVASTAPKVRLVWEGVFWNSKSKRGWPLLSADSMWMSFEATKRWRRRVTLRRIWSNKLYEPVNQNVSRNRDSHSGSQLNCPPSSGNFQIHNHSLWDQNLQWFIVYRPNGALQMTIHSGFKFYRTL